MGCGQQSLLAVSGAAPNFDPTAITGCTLWLAASNMVGFVDGDPVGGTGDEWVNAGSVSTNFIQGTANQRPTYETNEVNTWPVVRFVGTPLAESDRVSSALNMSSFGTVSAYTIFVVVRPTIGGGTDGSSRFYRRPRIFGTSSTVLWVGLYNTQFRVNHETLTGPSVATPTFTANNWYVVEAWFGGGTLSIKANNSTASTVGGAANLSSLASAPLVGTGTDLAYDGDTPEVIMYNNDIGSTNRDTVRNGLAVKYGITLLP
jgi:hypothetical protein